LIFAAVVVIALTVLFGYLGAAMLEAETGRKVLAAIAATIALSVVAELVSILIDRLHRAA
jgi:uncharacterized membrane protein